MTYRENLTVEDVHLEETCSGTSFLPDVRKIWKRTTTPTMPRIIPRNMNMTLWLCLALMANILSLSGESWLEWPAILKALVR
jgi:hypothetical protein